MVFIYKFLTKQPLLVVPGMRPKIPGLPRKIDTYQDQEPNQ